MELKDETIENTQYSISVAVKDGTIYENPIYDTSPFANPESPYETPVPGNFDCVYDTPQTNSNLSSMHHKENKSNHEQLSQIPAEEPSDDC